MTNVVDTNVLVVANGTNTNAPSTCQFACQTMLFQMRGGMERFPVDAGNLIFDEYFRNANRSGRPGIGDAFVKWLWENQGYEHLCELVPLHETDDEKVLFREIPDRPPFTHFDPNDQKFLAVAIASRFSATIYNATDTDDWAVVRPELPAMGIRFNQIC